MNLTRERIRQIDVKAFAKMEAGLRHYAAAQDDALEPGLPRVHQQVEREEGPPSRDTRDAWTFADEFLVSELVAEGVRLK